MDLSKVWDTVSTWITDHPTETTIGAVALGLGVLSVVVALVIKALRGKDLNAKASIGFGVVQVGVAYITITGVFEFFHLRLAMPVAEAWLLAAFIEACVWAAVGMIYAYGKGLDEKGKPNVGFGPAGPFFWTTVFGGGTLAILGSQDGTVATGRIVVVVLGAYMWYLRLLQVTRRSTETSRWAWTPTRLLKAIGALRPTEDDVKDELREWQVRQIARSIRWSNGHQPFKWLGSRSLTKRLETTQEDVIAEGRRRYAAAYVLGKEVRPDSATMQALFAVVRQAQTPAEERDVDAELAALDEQRRAELTERDRRMAELEERLAAAASSDDSLGLLDEVRAQLEQVSQLREQDQAAAAAAAREVALLKEHLVEVTTELEKIRREGDDRLAAIADELMRGATVTPEMVMEQHGAGSRRTAQRWIAQAREVADAREAGGRRPLQVVRGSQ